MEKSMNKIIIIGGGIAGLSAGIFAQLNGFCTTIIEKNAVVGGECVGWDRKSHHIDGCIHWLVGTQSGTDINELWKTVGALDGVEIFHPDDFLAFHYNGLIVRVSRDINVLKKEWIELSPSDEKSIIEFCDDIQRLHTFDIHVGKPFDLMTLKEKVKLIISMKEAGIIMKKYGKIDLKTYAKRYQHPAIRAMFSNFLPEGYQASSVFFALAMFMKSQASIPMGGSLEFSKRMEKRYLELGGKLLLNSEVQQINIHKKVATSVTLKNNTTIELDVVLAACDAHHFFHQLLCGKYNDRAFEMRFKNKSLYPLASQIQVSVSVDALMNQFPRTQSFAIDSLKVMNQKIERIPITHYAHETTFAPEGKTVLTISINQFENDIKDWFELNKNKEKYKETKKYIGEQIIKRIEDSMSGLKGKVKLLDVATPITYARYCNAYQGAFMSFLPTLKGKGMNHTGKIKGINNVYLIGQWLQPPGGLPVALITAKDSIMRLCLSNKKPFKSKIETTESK